jgi:hypothetical protein
METTTALNDKQQTTLTDLKDRISKDESLTEEEKRFCGT